MSSLQPYNPQPPSLICQRWSDVNWVSYGVTTALAGIKAWSSTVRGANHVAQYGRAREPVAHPAGFLNKCLAVVNMFLMGSVGFNCISSHLHQMQCKVEDPSIQKEMRKISQVFIDLIEEHQSKPWAQDCKPEALLKQNYHSAYKELALSGRHDSTLKIAQCVLSHAFPEDHLLKGSSIRPTDELKLHFEHLQTQKPKHTKEYQLSTLWLRLLQHFQA